MNAVLNLDQPPNPKSGDETTAPAAGVMTTGKAFGEIADINREHRLAQSCAAQAVEHAIRCGELLIAQKAKVAHGSFQTWIEVNCVFAYPTAARYMKAAREKSTGVEFSTLSELFLSGRKGAEKPLPDPVDASDDDGAEHDADEETGEDKGREDANFGPVPSADQPRLDQLDPKLVTCPHCQHEFDAREQLAP